MKQIKKDFKIIFFNSGFAGDLITSLYNPDLFISFNDNTVLLNDKVMKLKDYPFRIKNSFQQKIEYLESIEELGVCSSHDQELALRLKDNTTLVYCSDIALARVLYNRVERKRKDMLMSFEEHLNWQVTSRRVFKKQIDISRITDPDFLSNLGITHNKSAVILKEWIYLNDWKNL
jgi:hypothetical protein